jgi:hypothetical protein
LIINFNYLTLIVSFIHIISMWQSIWTLYYLTWLWPRDVFIWLIWLKTSGDFLIHTQKTNAFQNSSWLPRMQQQQDMNVLEFKHDCVFFICKNIS